MGKILCMGQAFTGGDSTYVSSWIATEEYTQHDIVQYNGVTYTCLQNCLGQQPSASSAYWKASSVSEAINQINRHSFVSISKPDEPAVGDIWIELEEEGV